MTKRHLSLILILITGLMPFATMQAQTIFEGCRNRIGIGVQGGIASMGDNTGAHNNPGGSTGLNITYARSLTKSFAILSGIDLSFARTFLKAKGITAHTTEQITLSDNNNLNLVRSTQAEYRFSSISEHYDIYYIAIPIQFILQGNAFNFSIEQFHQSYISLGAKIALPFKFNGIGTTSGAQRFIGPDLQDAGVTLSSPLADGVSEPLHTDYDAKAHLSPSLLILAVAEAGTMLKTNEYGALLLSFFIEYSILPSQLGSDQSMLTFDNNRLINNGYLASNLADKMRFFNCGIRIQYNFLFN